MKRHLQCAEQQASPSNLTKHCACHAKLHSKIKEKLAQNGWIVIYNARPIRPWSDHGPTTIRAWTRHLAPARSPRLLFVLRRRILHWKLQHFALWLSTQIWPNTAPATKSDTATSPNLVPATKSDTATVPNSAPARKSGKTVTLLNCYFTQLLPYWAVTLLSCCSTELLLDWTVTLLSCYFTELLLYWAVAWLSCYLTELLLYWAVTLLSCYFTGLFALLNLRNSEVSQLNFLWSISSCH